VTGAFFVWLYCRNREGFAIFRDGFLLATAIALVIHWRYPTAPPRLAHVGIKDTMELYSDVNIGRPHHERFSNPVAAVPSLHAGWAIALGVGLMLYARNSLLRAAGVLYPAVVLLTIVVTGITSSSTQLRALWSWRSASRRRRRSASARASPPTRGLADSA
jgi:hypothetical protein